MRLLIDGYNLMHATILPSGKVSPEQLRNFRHRFLNDLAHHLGPLEAAQATVVFDAGPGPRPEGDRRQPHKGLTVIYAYGADSADDRIEELIRKHSAPKGLTVVSSDRRVRQAAERRRCTVVSSSDFWDNLESAARRRKTEARSKQPSPAPPGVSGNTGEWERAFRDVDDLPEMTELRRRPGYAPTEDEFTRIAREVAEESSDRLPLIPRRNRRP